MEEDRGTVAQCVDGLEPTAKPCLLLQERRSYYCLKWKYEQSGIDESLFLMRILMKRDRMVSFCRLVY
jgi:hypothetical protein